MRIQACALVLACVAPAAAQDGPLKGLDFMVDWPDLVGHSVTVEGGRVAGASAEFALLQVPGGLVKLSPPWTDREDLRYLFEHCTSLAMGDACAVTVTGQVQRQSNQDAPELVGVDFLLPDTPIPATSPQIFQPADAGLGAEPLPPYVQMAKGRVRVFRTERNFENVIIGNPKVLTSYPLSKMVAAVTAQEDGESTLVFVDETGEVVASADFSVATVVPVPPPAPGGLDRVTVHSHLPTERRRISLQYLCHPIWGCDPYSSANGFAGIEVLDRDVGSEETNGSAVGNIPIEPP